MSKDLEKLSKLRPLGSLERYKVARSRLGVYYNVAVTARYKCPPTTTIAQLSLALFNALDVVLSQHPILSAIPVDIDPISPYFAQLPAIDLNQVIEFVDIARYGEANDGSDSVALDRFLEERHNQPFEYTEPLTPFWRLYVFENASDNSQFTLSFVFHHCIADTQSAIVFHQDFETALNTTQETNSLGVLKFSRSTLFPPLEEVFPGPVESSLVETCPGKEWTGAKQFLPVRTRFCSYSLSEETTQHLVQRSKTNSVSLTATLQTMLVAALFRLIPDDFDTLKVDCPISLRQWLPSSMPPTVIGCFTDNFCTQYQRKPFSWDEVYRTKRSIDNAVQRRGGDNVCGKIAQIPDLETWLKGKMGQARSSALELSNVGRLARQTEARAYQIEGLLFSQSAGACSGAIKVSVATGRDGRLTLGFSWQEGVVHATMVGDLIIELKRVIIEVLASQ